MSLETNKPLTNTFAETGNVVQVRIAEAGDCAFLPLDFEVTFTATTAKYINNLSAQPLYNALTVRLTDGNAEIVSIYNPAAPAVLSEDITGLDISKDWLLEVFYAPIVTVGVDCPCQKSFTYTIKGTKNGFDKTFISTQEVAVLEVSVDGNAVTDGATEVLPGAALNDIVIVPLNLANTGVANLNITKINITGDGETAGYTYDNGSLEGGNSFDFASIKMDTTTLGAKKVIVEIATDEALNPTYTIDIELTVA